MKKVLIIGGTGFIGTYLLKYLKYFNYKITLFILPTDKKLSMYLNDHRFNVIIGDVTDPNSYSSEMFDVDAIIYMAGTKNRNTRKIRQVYCEAPAILAKLAYQKGVRQFIYISNISVYGDCGEHEVKEEGNFQPNSQLGEIIETAEQSIRTNNSYHQILRLPAVYGNNTLAEMPSPIIVNNGMQWVNYVFVMDVVWLIQQMIENPVYTTFHVSDGQPYRQKEIAKILSDCWGKKVTCTRTEEMYKKGIPDHTIKILTNSVKLDITKVRKFYPHYTPIKITDLLMQRVESIESS